ncbi:hypothetical protein D3C73_1219270 [compost metagenome]
MSRLGRKLIGNRLAVFQNERIPEDEASDAVRHLFGYLLDDASPEAVPDENDVMQVQPRNIVDNGLRDHRMRDIFVRIFAVTGIFRRIDGMPFAAQRRRYAVPEMGVGP